LGDKGEKYIFENRRPPPMAPAKG